MAAAGRLRHIVELQELVNELDSDGTTVSTWLHFSMERAEISPLSGRELIAARAVQAKVNTRIVMRFRPFVVPTMRVLHGSTIYDIEAVIPDPDSGRRWLTLLCSSGVNEG